MALDKQLRSVKLSSVLRKRHLDQALSAKEFAVLAGVSYSTARSWFRQPGFPEVCGVVFWTDFELWRRVRNGLPTGIAATEPKAAAVKNTATEWDGRFTGRAAQILAEAGGRVGGKA